MVSKMLDFCSKCGSWVAPEDGQIIMGKDAKTKVICDGCSCQLADFEHDLQRVADEDD